MSVMPTIEHRVERVSPACARRMLERVVSNAKLDQAALTAFARDMQEGRWALNGAPIILSKGGELLDGRMRLNACVQSDTPFDTVIVEGVDADAFETIDAVRKRTLADVLSMRKEKHGRALAAALRILWAYGAGGAPGFGRAPTPTTLLGVLEEHPGIRNSVLPALRAVPLLPHGCGIALHYLGSAVDPVRAGQFLQNIQNLERNSSDDPTAQLRQILTDMRGQGGNRKQNYILAIGIKAMNSFLTDKPVKVLRYAPDREKFPRVTGERDWGVLSRVAAPRVSEITQVSRERVKVRIIRIGPETAEEMLNYKGPNRTISASVVSKYARDIEAGRWRLNGQTIKISAAGVLLDGQHRLEAVKKSKKDIVSIVVDGLPDEIINSVDTGKRRSVSDILRDRGEIHTIILSSALRWLWIIRSGVVLAANYSPSTGELLEMLDNTPTIRDSLRSVIAIREIMGSGIAAALHCIFSEKDADRANVFFERLIDGAELSKDSPILHLRERLIKTRKSHRIRIAEAERVALSIKAWKSFLENKPMQLLSWRNRGAARESLPSPL